jgi:small GTP-binding protein
MSGVPKLDKPRLKLILVGHSGVGKTCLIASFLKKPFDPKGLATVSPAYMFQDMPRRDGLIVTLQIWDTAGQERYHSVSEMFYRDANVAFVCFETGSSESLDSVPDWVNKVKKEVPECDFIFVGTKADLIPVEEHSRLLAAAQHQLAELQPKGVHLTSAMNREGVEDVFKGAAELYVPRQQLTKLRKQPEPKPAAGAGDCKC